MTAFDNAPGQALNLRLIRSRALPEGLCADDIVYEGWQGSGVTATLLRPAPVFSRPAGILMLHWGFGDRNSFFSEGLAYARAGALVLSIDAPGAGDRGKGLPRLDQPDIARSFLIQTVTELRRGVDVLLSCEANPDRIGYVGHSLGAAVGVPFAGAEHRLAAAVLMTPLGELSRGGWALKPTAQYVEAMAPLDGVKTIGAASAALCFQFGDRDPWVRRDAAERLCAAAPKAECRWYPADHRLSAIALADRAKWLGIQLQLEPPAAAWLDGVGLPKRDLSRHAITTPLYQLARLASGLK